MRLPLRALALVIAVLLAFVLPNAVELATDWWWFGEVGHQQVFSTTLTLRAVLGGIALAAGAGLAGGARQDRRPDPAAAPAAGVHARRADDVAARTPRDRNARHRARRRRGGHRRALRGLDLAGGAGLAAGRGLRRRRPGARLRRRVLRLHAAGHRTGAVAGDGAGRAGAGRRRRDVPARRAGGDHAVRGAAGRTGPPAPGSAGRPCCSCCSRLAPGWIGRASC